ncbi:MAG: hypothetical protein QXD10_09460 [Metallosphaera sp.]|uniref:hypothetical protein n=1 Tax=Metallosphaera sp. TaxID=2020860 RepID=UPI003168C823
MRIRLNDLTTLIDEKFVEFEKRLYEETRNLRPSFKLELKEQGSYSQAPRAGSEHIIAIKRLQEQVIRNSQELIKVMRGKYFSLVLRRKQGSSFNGCHKITE